jgi:type IV pilus assembly protein PilP
MKRLITTCKLFTLTAVLMLAGCGDSGIGELRSWMDQMRRETRAVMPKLSAPKQFTPFTYAEKKMIDPYNPAKLMNAFAKSQARSLNPIAPDPERPREALEAYPLDALRMVGTLQKTGLSYALLQADKTIHHIKVGNYIGQNLGMVTSISESTVELKEVVQDPAGDWIERKAKLELQETKK